jgi:hypothetical protein
MRLSLWPLNLVGMGTHERGLTIFFFSDMTVSRCTATLIHFLEDCCGSVMLESIGGES